MTYSSPDPYGHRNLNYKLVFSGGFRNFKKGSGAPERGAHPSKIEKNKVFGFEMLSFTNITW
jgi:hypothetical protein